jgi:hypothetical protein
MESHQPNPLVPGASYRIDAVARPVNPPFVPLTGAYVRAYQVAGRMSLVFAVRLPVDRRTAFLRFWCHNASNFVLREGRGLSGPAYVDLETHVFEDTITQIKFLSGQPQASE